MKAAAAAFIFLCLTTKAMAASIPDSVAIRAIVGEAEGEPYLGKVAVAEVIRRRGKLDGIFGKDRPLKDVPPWVWRDCAKAWKESEHTDLTHGATHWESTDFKKPYWTKYATATAHIGKHIFYSNVNPKSKKKVKSWKKRNVLEKSK